jgi:hypothetical protein
MPEKEKQDKIAEVIAAETAAFTAQSYELYELPPLGSLVKAGDTYAIVCHAETAGLDTGRKPVARGRDEATEEAVYSASPQLTKLLRSSFTAAAVGYKEGGKVFQYLPPRPAKLHSFVYVCPPEEAKEFGKNLSFLNILVNAQLPVSNEEVVAAALRQMAKAQDDPRQFLVGAGKELANLLSTDFTRLKNILGRLNP